MRRRMIVSVLTAGLIGVGSAGLIGAGSVAVAAPGDHDGMQGAVVAPGVNCRMRLDPSGTPFLFTTDSQAEITPSGVVNLQCHASQPTGSVEPFTQKGFECAVGPAGLTTDSVIVWTQSGQGNLTCHGRIP
jgi:hypothetical protein